MILIYIVASLVGIIILFLFIKLVQLNAGNKKVAQELDSITINKLPDIGSVNHLSILPLVDFYAEDARLKTEAGVSYLIKADDCTILMDVGFNKSKEHPSPLVHNAKALDVSLDNVDMIFISHLHLDHVGGMKEQKQKQFSLSQGPVALPEVPVYSPVPISASKWNPGPVTEVVTEPKILKKGIASIGVIPRNLFIMGYTLENSLAINVEGKGIVLIVGCGHQTIERIVDRARYLFDLPIYGIVGGLHYPIKNGRLMLGPFNLQNIGGSHRPPWNGINEKDLSISIQTIKKSGAQFVSLSPHDSSDWSIDRFRHEFRETYHDLTVGKELII
jgi:7,8-dihydropterin-6-yl-methyl-4-(beta-D-ribofuranosyl)aminobenzene 5'-phosphate synthase